MSDAEGERFRNFTANEPRVEHANQRGTPKGIPFTYLAENQAEKAEGRKGEAYPPEVYRRVIDNLKEIVLTDINRPEASEHERGAAYTLLMVTLGLQELAYDHLGAKGQVDFKDDLFSLIKSQKDWEVQPISPAMRLWENSFELTLTQGKLLQRIAEGLKLVYDPGGEFDIRNRTFNYVDILQRPITKRPDDPEEYTPHYDSEIKAYLQAKQNNRKGS